MTTTPHEHDASCAFGNPTCPAFGEEPTDPRWCRHLHLPHADLYRRGALAQCANCGRWHHAAEVCLTSIMEWRPVRWWQYGKRRTIAKAAR